MKKYLLSTLMLACSPAFAGEFVYDYGSTANGFYGYSDYADKYKDNRKQYHTPISAEIYTSAGYKFDAENLLKVGIDAQIAGGKEVEDYNHGKWGENIYATYQAKFGDLSVGQIYNAAYQMAVGAPSVGAFRVNNSMITDFIANPNWQRHSRIASYRTLNSTYLNTDADAFKVSYVTPQMYNTKLALSYTPDSYSEAGLNNKHSQYAHRSSYAAGIYNDLDLDYVDVETSLGYAYNKKNNQELSAGISLYRKGWTLGGSYRKTFTASGDYALNNVRADDMIEYFDGFRKGQAYNVGLSYEIGPLKTGVSYFTTKADETEAKDQIITWANRFALNKYAALYLAGAFAQYEGDKYESNRGYAAIGGVELTF